MLQFSSTFSLLRSSQSLQLGFLVPFLICLSLLLSLFTSNLNFHGTAEWSLYTQVWSSVFKSWRGILIVHRTPSRWSHSQGSLWSDHQPPSRPTSWCFPILHLVSWSMELLAPWFMFYLFLLSTLFFLPGPLLLAPPSEQANALILYVLAQNSFTPRNVLSLKSRVYSLSTGSKSSCPFPQ